MKGMIVLILTGFTLFAYSQDIVQVSIGANYANQVYYTLANDDMTVIGNNAWDLAFAQTESSEAGIHVNESVTLSMMGTSPSTLLYLAPGQDFNEPIDPEMVGDSLYNDEFSWANGALNVPRNPDDFADFGWGFYNTENHAIIGNRVFVIQLRDGSYRKFMIESLISGVYTLKYANLDGSFEKTVSIDKNDFVEKPLILFSFLEDKVLDNLPEGYDLIFQRYSDLDPSNAGVFVEYTVTGILAAPGVLSAQANNIDDPEEVDHTIYLDSLVQQIDIIGQDWKFFSFESGWNILEDVTFFVKTNDNHLWQIYIYDFEGSSSGTYTFAKWDHGVVANTTETNSGVKGFTVVPNPVKLGSDFSIVLETEEAFPAHIVLVGHNGQRIRHYEKLLVSGLNAFKIPSAALAKGMYYVQIQTASGQISQPLVVK